MSADATLASRLNYSQCWEDDAVLTRALDAGEGKRVLSIASAGDNSIALAMTGAQVVAIDLSFPQIATCELKLAGRALSHRQYLQLLGAERGMDPVALYRRVRTLLSPEAAAYWDDNAQTLRYGVLRAGRFERYLATFRDRILPFIHRPSTTRQWTRHLDPPEQRRFYRERWDNWRWRGLFRLFFSQRVMAWRGRSPEQFAHVDGPVGSVILGRVERVLTDVPMRDNGYMQWILTGDWHTPSAWPAYLTRAGHRRLGEVSERIELVHASMIDYARRDDAGGFDGFNLSDIFEYLSVDQSRELYEALLEVANPGARFAYWNLFVDRRRPDALADRVRCLDALASELHATDRFVYGSLRIEEKVA